jgi:RNA polymerase sigma-70 factor (ECF subfamily)
MIKVKDGDVDKMATLYERYYRELYRFIFKMTSRRELSEDMVQNIFYRMLKYRKGFTGTGEFRTWMYHIARNTIYDQFRKEKRTPSSNSLEIKNYEGRLTGDEPADVQMEKQHELMTLEIAMNNLSAEYRELLILCRFQELRYSEIATILNISEGAVKVRVHRALNQLRNNFFGIRNKIKPYGMPVL